MSANPDPIEAIRHNITHPAPPKRGTACLPTISDFECGMRYWWAAFDWRMDKLIAAAGERELRAHWRQVESVRRSLGQMTRRRVMR